MELDFFNRLYTFQRLAFRKQLNSSDRLTYLNLLIRGNLEDSDEFEMTTDELHWFTGLHRNTLMECKRRLKNQGFIDYHKSKCTLCKLDDTKLCTSVERNTPAPPKKNKKLQKTPNGEGAREEMIIISEPEWK